MKKLKPYMLLVMLSSAAALVMILNSGMVDAIEPTVFEPRPVHQNTNVSEIPKVSVEDQIRSIAAEKHYQAPNFLVRLAKCESSLNPSATNRSGARGLFQIMPSHKDVTNECAYNVDCATRWTIDRLSEGKGSWWTCTNIIQ